MSSSLSEQFRIAQRGGFPPVVEQRQMAARISGRLYIGRLASRAASAYSIPDTGIWPPYQRRTISSPSATTA